VPRRSECVTTLNLVVLTQVHPQIWGALGPRSLGRGVADLLETRPSRPLPTWVTMLNLIAYDQTVRTYVGSSAGKLGFSRPALQGQSGHREPTRIDRLPMTSYYSSYFALFTA